MPLTIDELFASPDHYLHSFDGADAIFVPMDRAAYRRSIFLDDRISPARQGAMRIPLSALETGGNGCRTVSWIFHVAHCGSTLLARALDELGRGLVLREPLALRQAAIADDGEKLALVLRMLGKRYAETAAPVVKANVPVNFVIPQIARAQPEAAAIFLHYGLSDYLFAILRSDNHRAWLRRVTSELAGQLGDLEGLTDGERAAALWLAQLRQFRDGLERMPRARTLNAEDFFAHPGQVLCAAAELFGLEVPGREIDALVDGPLFASYAKNPAVPFDNEARLARRRELMSALTPELESAQRWTERAAPELDGLTDAIAQLGLLETTS